MKGAELPGVNPVILGGVVKISLLLCQGVGYLRCG